jgi:hypothetical protein
VRLYTSSGISPYGYRFVYQLLNGTEVESHTAINKKLRIRGNVADLIPHLAEVTQAEKLCELKARGLKPAALMNELRLKGLAQDCRRAAGVELSPANVTDMIKSYQLRKTNIRESS